jgi:hypothetical protein
VVINSNGRLINKEAHDRNFGVVVRHWETCCETENLGVERNSARQEETPKKGG